MENNVKYDLIRPEYSEDLKQTSQLYKTPKLTNVPFYVTSHVQGILSLLKYRLLCFPVLLFPFPLPSLSTCALQVTFFGYYSRFEN